MKFVSIKWIIVDINASLIPQLFIKVFMESLLHAVPPLGHVITNEKWRNSALIQSLKGGGVTVMFEAELGAADFHLPNKICILYVSECDIIAGNGFKRKLVQFRNASNSFQVLVLLEKTRLSEQYFPAVQKFVVFDLGLTLLPVSGQTDASQLIAQIVHGEGRENPFRRRSSSRLLDPLVLALVQQVPGVGRVKALALLQNFPSLQQLCNADVAQLEAAVGQAAAQHIYGFFHKTTAS
ncbi:Fanconi anemia core complex-associated protein 24 [Genypterus blacodes]|uniref:Fanconi anemia core complex-associated protein 24 n=1 Tax=Genypterus blacodes TaxID=154954 RepID=UPI003F776FC8